MEMKKFSCFVHALVPEISLAPGFSRVRWMGGLKTDSTVLSRAGKAAEAAKQSLVHKHPAEAGCY